MLFYLFSILYVFFHVLRVIDCFLEFYIGVYVLFIY